MYRLFKIKGESIMGILNIIGKVILSFVIIGIIIGVASMYFFGNNILEINEKMRFIDELNHQLPDSEQLTYNPLTGEVIHVE